jgi:D-alanine-D-alanine ligase
MNKKVVILYNQLSPNPTPDEQDVISQVELVNKTLIELGYEPSQLSLAYDIKNVLDKLKETKPLFAVNLFESIENKCEFLYFGPALLNSLHIPFTGFPLEALFLTTNKVLTKQQLRLIGINTADWFTDDTLHLLKNDKLYIVKTIWEEGSLGLDEDCIFKGSDKAFIEKFRKERSPKSYFVEEYIDGREINVAMLGSENGPEVLPMAEILFIGYPEEKYKMVGYKAKWVEDSYEYNNTPRTFDIEGIPDDTRELISIYCRRCWNHFGGRGYARVDLRVSKGNVPFVLEVNGNPCITEGGGYYSALQKAGYTFKDAFQRIISDTLR